jgi:hypothetical protein
MGKRTRAGAGRAAPRPAAPSGAAAISDTLMAFARPLLDLVPEPPTAERVRPMMTLAVVAWNLPIYVRERRAEAAGMRAALDEALAGAPKSTRDLVADRMIARLTKHAADPRTVTVEVRAGGEGEQPVVVTIGEE